MAKGRTALGRRLLERRVELNISVEEAARRSGISEGTYSRAEKGDRNTQAGTVGKIAEGLELDPTELLALHDGESVGQLARSNADRAIEIAAMQLRELPASIRRSLLTMIEELHKELGPPF